MILAIDIGNTNIVIGCCADGQVIFRERVSTNTPQRCSNMPPCSKWRLI